MSTGIARRGRSDPSAGPPATVEVSSDSLTVVLDRRDASVVRLTSRLRPWTVVQRRTVGSGFALRIPLDGRRNNVADSGSQAPPTWEVDPATGAVTATWHGVVSEHGGAHDVDVVLQVRGDGRRLVFGLEVDNRSDLVVEDVRFPRLDGLRPPTETPTLSAFSYRYAAGRRRPLWPTFDNVPGYYGVDVPTYLNEGEGTVGAPVAPFVLLETGREGVCVSVDEPSSELVAWVAELRPGYGDSMARSVPDLDDDALPEPVGIRFDAAHLPYVGPGERRRLTPVALTAYVGDWHAGADAYLERRRTWMTHARPPAWAAEPHAWLQLHVNSPEDELRLPFARLPEVAASCAAHDVRVIQLVGWNTGGQDRGNPSHEADPRLGGDAELRRAIAACQRLGVRVVLFAKFTWADRSSRRFREELVREAVKDPYGDHYLHPGYRYQTVAQLLDVNTRRLVPMCFASPRYRAVAEADFEHLLDLGADGMLFDESLHHSPALLCFDPDHGHRAGHPVYAADRELVAGFRRVAAGRDAAFLYAGEACYDWELEAYELSYHRSEDPEHVPLSRYLAPDALLMTAVTGFDDRSMCNQALMHRYVISYEPYNFKGRLEDFPRTVAYGRAVDELRRELQPWLWDAEFRDTVGARVTRADGTPHRPYAVFRRRDTGECAVVLVNAEAAHPVALTVELTVPAARADRRWRTVEDPDWHDLDGVVTVPPRSAVVVLPAS